MVNTTGWHDSATGAQPVSQDATREMRLPDTDVTVDRRQDTGHTVELHPDLYGILVHLNGVRKFDLHKICHPYTKVSRADTGEECIVIDDQGVSNPQCKIGVERESDGQVWNLTVEDLESKNGTWINGKLVAKAVLTDRDVIKVGDTELLYIRV